MIEEMEKALFTDAISIRSFMRMSLDLHKDLRQYKDRRY